MIWFQAWISPRAVVETAAFVIIFVGFVGFHDLIARFYRVIKSSLQTATTHKFQTMAGVIENGSACGCLFVSARTRVAMDYNQHKCLFYRELGIFTSLVGFPNRYDKMYSLF